MAPSTSKTSRYREVERKFDVVESTVAPSFEGLSAVARVERSPSQLLDAIYFDTSAYDLAANHVTLRRRTGGPDAGWHLKLPAGPDARTEGRAPLDDGASEGDADAVPEGLLEVVRAIVRNRPVGPVARITTDRTVDVLCGPDGSARAEFCDDQVTAWAGENGAEQRWREWELELAESADAVPDLLERLPHPRLGAPGQPPPDTVGGGRGSPPAPPATPTKPNRTRGPSTRCTARWPSRSTSCLSGIAQSGPTPTTRCTRCGSPPARSAACCR